MKIMKTKFLSYCYNGIPKGCEYCVRGEKLVIFMSGACGRNCWYCSLSESRKKQVSFFANEREFGDVKELIEEATESGATSVGITGGDPLLFVDKIVEYVSVLKERFGKGFHTHIYLPTMRVSRENLLRLSGVVDEVRFHPSFLILDSEEETLKDAEKIRIALDFWGRENVGIELPMIPDKKEKIIDFILKVKDIIGFVNLNEFEMSETNFELLTEKYELTDDGYVVADSKKAGLWVLEECRKMGLGLKVHLCTADTKNIYQYRNRLRRHKILPYGKRTDEGNVVYLAVYCAGDWEEFKKKFSGKVYFDERKKRAILSEDVARRLLGKMKVERVEEFPTWEGYEIERNVIGD